MDESTPDILAVRAQGLMKTFKGTRGLTKRFPGQCVLRGATIEIARGSALVLQGANGAGKTTLLRILATVVIADAGSAQIDGFDVRREPARVRERIGVAFVNERSIFWRLNAFENLMLFAATRGVPPSQRRQHIEIIGDQLGLNDLMSRRISDLSTGQRQRVILARAALGDPRVLLIDEPLRGLDDVGVEQVLKFLASRLAQGSSALIAAPTVTEFRGQPFSLARLSEGMVEPATWDGRGAA